MAMDEKLDKGGDDMGRLIADTVNQLAQLILLETCGKFGLSAEHLKICPNTQQIREIKKTLYKLTITFEGLQAKAKVTLNDEAITEKLKEYATRRTLSPTWVFFGFIKQRPLISSSFQSSAELWEQADIQTQHSGKFTLNVTQKGITYSGLFLIMFENDERVVLEDEARMMVEIPASPSTADVLELKAKLKTLFTLSHNQNSKDPSFSRFEDEVNAAQAIYKKKIEMALTIVEETAQRNAMEQAKRDFNDTLAKIFDKYKE